MQRLLTAMLEAGAAKRNIVAKVFGGANVLDFNTRGNHIGHRNIELAISMLEEMGIPVIAKSVGGGHGRKIIFDLSGGKVHQRMINKVKMKTMPVPEAKTMNI